MYINKVNSCHTILRMLQFESMSAVSHIVTALPIVYNNIKLIFYQRINGYMIRDIDDVNINIRFYADN